jgi:hypothetical protein
MSFSLKVVFPATCRTVEQQIRAVRNAPQTSCYCCLQLKLLLHLLPHLEPAITFFQFSSAFAPFYTPQIASARHRLQIDGKVVFLCLEEEEE